MTESLVCDKSACWEMWSTPCPHASAGARVQDSILLSCGVVVEEALVYYAIIDEGRGGRAVS